MQDTEKEQNLINPNVSVDCVIIGFDGEELKALLVRQVGREGAGHENFMKLPGSLIYYDEDLDEAARRVLYELTGITELDLLQFRAFGSKNRTNDPKDTNWLQRFHQLNSPIDRIVTIAYLTMVKIDRKLMRLSSQYDACWVGLNEIGELAFDHNQIIKESMSYIRQFVEANPVVLFDLLPKKFTASELRKLYELIFDKTCDIRNFHKKVAQSEYIIPLDEKQVGVPHRAARYYKFDRKIYNKLHGSHRSFQLA